MVLGRLTRTNVDSCSMSYTLNSLARLRFRSPYHWIVVLAQVVREMLGCRQIGDWTNCLFYCRSGIYLRLKCASLAPYTELVLCARRNVKRYSTQRAAHHWRQLVAIVGTTHRATATLLNAAERFELVVNAAIFERNQRGQHSNRTLVLFEFKQNFRLLFG